MPRGFLLVTEVVLSRCSEGQRMRSAVYATAMQRGGVIAEVRGRCHGPWFSAMFTTTSDNACGVCAREVNPGNVCPVGLPWRGGSGGVR